MASGYGFTIEQATNERLRPSKIFQIRCWVIVHVGLHLVLLEDGLLGSCHEIHGLVVIPLNEADGVLGGASHAVVNATIRDEYYVGSSKNGVHVFVFVNGSEGRLDHVNELVVGGLPYL